MQASLVTLEQSLEPNFRPPKPFDGLIKGDSSFRINAYYLTCIHGFQNYRAGSKNSSAWVAAGIAAHQLKTILEQLRGEVPKIKSGMTAVASIQPGILSVPSSCKEIALQRQAMKRIDPERTRGVVPCLQATLAWSHGRLRLVPSQSLELPPVMTRSTLEAAIASEVLTWQRRGQ